MTRNSDGHVWLVGAGPGDPGLITVTGLDALRRADVVLYDRLSPAELLGECRKGVLLIDAGKGPGDHSMTQDQINTALVEYASEGRLVVRLKGGDPYVFGRGGEEASALGIAGVGFTIVPGVTSSIGGLASAGIPVTHRDYSSSFAVVTGHEDPMKSEGAVDWQKLATAVDTLVVLMGVGRLEAIVSNLISGGRDAATPSALIEAASTPDQRVVEAPLGDICARSKDSGIEPPALFVVGNVIKLRRNLGIGGSPLARRRVLVTRTRTQSSTLAAALRAEGASAVVLPAIEIEHRADPEAVRSSIERLHSGDYAWTIFSSTNAVNVFLDLLTDHSVDIRVFGQSQLCAVGESTAGALAARGLMVDLVAEEATGDGIVHALCGDQVAGQSILLPRAESGNRSLPDGLRNCGASVDELTLYLAALPLEPSKEVLDLVRAGKIDVVTFTSSSTVRNLATLLEGDIGVLRSATIACIGPSTASTAAEIGLPPHVVADDPSVPGLISGLRSYLSTERGESIL